MGLDEVIIQETILSNKNIVVTKIQELVTTIKITFDAISKKDALKENLDKFRHMHESLFKKAKNAII